MSTDPRLRDQLREGIGDGTPEPGLRARVIASLPDDPRPSRIGEWAMGATALVLTLALAGGLLYAGGVFNRGHQNQPATDFKGRVALLAVGDLKCRLPIGSFTGGAFISFPDGGLSLDPAASTGTFYGKGYGGYQQTYDSVTGKWLAVPPSAISPDQKSFAFISTTSGIPGQPPTAALHTMDAAGGHDREIWQGVGSGQILGWTPAGIFFSFYTTSKTGPGEGVLNALDPATGAVRTVATLSIGTGPARGTELNGQFSLIGNGAAWGIGYPVQPTPVAPADGTASYKSSGPNRVLRLDLKDGAITTWYTAAAGEAVTVAALDAAGSPIVMLQTIPAPVKGGPGVPPNPNPTFTPPRYGILSAPDKLGAFGDASDEMFKPQSFYSDSHGLWMGTPNGSIYLLSKSGLRKVAVVGEGLIPSPSIPTGFGKDQSSPPPGYTPPTPPPGYSGVNIRVAGPCT